MGVVRLIRARKQIILICLSAALCVLLSACGAYTEDIQQYFDAVIEREEENVIVIPDISLEEAQSQSGVTGVVKEQDSEEDSLEVESEGYREYFLAHAGEFAFETLNEVEKYWYVDIYNTLSTMGTDVELNVEGIAPLGVKGIEQIFQCVFQDHPEIFYVTGYTYTQYTKGEETVRITFSGTYTMSAEEVTIRKEQIALYVEDFLAGISMGSTDYAKVKYVYEYLVMNTEYNLQAPENQNICSVFIGRESVCQGYAKATQYLLGILDVPATLVTGQVGSGEGHAWNLVKVDGEYYYVDTTWGDASYQVSEDSTAIESTDLPGINYDYLCVTTAQLERTHVIDNVVPMPVCTAATANYYVVEGAYFTTYDKDQLYSLFQKGNTQGRHDVTIKCSDDSVYQTMVETLIDSQEIFKFLNLSEGTVAYVENREQLSLTFWITEK